MGLGFSRERCEIDDEDKYKVRPFSREHMTPEDDSSIFAKAHND